MGSKVTGKSFGIGRDAAHARQFVELADNGSFVRGAITIDLAGQIRRQGGPRDQQGQSGSEAFHFLAAITLISTFTPRSSLATCTKARAG